MCSIILLESKVSPHLCCQRLVESFNKLVSKVYTKVTLYQIKVGASILHDAAVKGRIEAIEWIINNTPLTASYKDTTGKQLFYIFFLKAFI